MESRQVVFPAVPLNPLCTMEPNVRTKHNDFISKVQIQSNTINTHQYKHPDQLLLPLSGADLNVFREFKLSGDLLNENKE